MIHRICLSVLLAAAAPALGQSAKPAFKPDQKVEVREGDEWSAATIVKQEGRKLQVRYEDGTEEWVSSDRLRPPTPGGIKPATDKRGETKPGRVIKPPVKEQFAVGAKVEVKDQDWTPGVVKNREGDLYLIVTDRYPQKFHWMWAHVSGVRKVGSSKEGPNRTKTVRVHSGSVDEARLEARKTFENIEDELAAEATRTPGLHGAMFEATPYDKPIADINLDKVLTLAPDRAPNKLTIFDPLPAAAAKLTDKPVALTSKGERPYDIPDTILMGGGRAIIPYYTSGGASETRTLRVELLDLVGAKSLGMIKSDPLSKPLALSPSGNRMAGGAFGFFSGTRKRLDVFELAPASVADSKHLISFTPYVTAEYRMKDVDWVSFTDDDHLMTCTRDGDLTCWDPAKATARWRIKIKGLPAASPGGRQVAGLTDQGIAVIDVIACKVICIGGGRSSYGAIAFTPDGKRVIGIEGRTVCGWDLEKGESLPEIGLPVKAESRTAFPLDRRFVLIGGSDLLDLDKKIVVWRYNNSGAKTFAHGGRVWMLSGGGGARGNGQPVMLSSATFPHAGAVKAADASAAGEGLLVKPGSAVAVSVTLDGATPEQQAKVAAVLTERLNAVGIRVDPASSIKLIARNEASQQPGYRITRVLIEHDGKVAWDSRSAEAVANTFNLRFLDSIRVPAYVAVPLDKPWLGTSTWTMNGIGRDQLIPRAPAAAAAGPAPAEAGDGLE